MSRRLSAPKDDGSYETSVVRPTESVHRRASPRRLSDRSTSTTNGHDERKPPGELDGVSAAWTGR